MKKYRLTNEVNERGLHRIMALRDIPRYGVIKAGDLGGFVGSEKNLSQDGDAWIADDAEVLGNARISENALVYDNALVSGNAHVFGNAQVFGDVYISGNAEVYDNACVFGHACVYDNALVSGNAHVFDNVYISGNAEVYDNALVSGNAHVFGNACAGGYAEIFGDAKVSSDKDYIVFKNWWSSKRYFTWTRSNNMWKVGCFYGTGEELIAKAEKDSELSGREYRRVVEYVESILKDEKLLNKEVSK